MSTPNPLVIEDDLDIQMALSRLCTAMAGVTVAYKEHRQGFQAAFQEPGRFLLHMAHTELEAWALETGAKVSIAFRDRGFDYEAVTTFQRAERLEGSDCCALAFPRSLRRTDGHRLASFVPDDTPKCTFTNSRNAILDGQVRGFGAEGLELAFRTPGLNMQEVLRMGEEAVLDLNLGDGPHLMAPTKVAYYGENCVGLKFSDKMDEDVLNQYRQWVSTQQSAQAQREREAFTSGARPAVRAGAGMDLPQVKVWTDRDPMVLVITEKEDFARRMSEALGRKFGILSLDYIKGMVRPFLRGHGGDQDAWGRVRMILIHNQLRLSSPLELSRQIVEQEKCPLPIILMGTEEDQDLKRNRALGAGAVDYVPVEPFRILSVLRKLDETLKLFE